MAKPHELSCEKGTKSCLCILTEGKEKEKKTRLKYDTCFETCYIQASAGCFSISVNKKCMQSGRWGEELISVLVTFSLSVCSSASHFLLGKSVPPLPNCPACYLYYRPLGESATIQVLLCFFALYPLLSLQPTVI